MIIKISGKNATLYIKNIEFEDHLKFNVVFTKRHNSFTEDQNNNNHRRRIFVDKKLDEIWSGMTTPRDIKLHIESFNISPEGLKKFLANDVGVVAASDIMNIIAKMKDVKMLFDDTNF